MIVKEFFSEAKPLGESNHSRYKWGERKKDVEQEDKEDWQTDEQVYEKER